jgi:peroxiredoxin
MQGPRVHEIEEDAMGVQKGRKSVASHTPTLRVGDTAPDFELTGHRDGEKVRLSHFKGKKNVVLAFYPLDWTPVCSTEIPTFEADSEEFDRHDTQVLGISVDSVHSHNAWAKSLGGVQSYPLLADFHPKGEVAKRYGVWKEDKGISERAVFVIDKTGTVRYIDVHEIGEQPDPEAIFEQLRKL